MDNEQKYNEALERAKKIYKSKDRSDSFADIILEQIFSELKESEDEKIRKNCIHFLELQKAHHASTVEIDECIAWLEKQKPVEWSEEDKKMIDRLIRKCEKEHKNLCNDVYGHQDIVSDLKHSCREEWDWLNSLKQRITYL